MSSSGHRKLRHRARSLRLPSPRAAASSNLHNDHVPLSLHPSEKHQSNNKEWPPASISNEEPLTRTSLLQTRVYLGAAEFAARVYRRPWNDTLMYLVCEGSTETTSPTFLVSSRQFILFEQFYPPQPGADLVDSNYWINGRGIEPGTITFSQWIHDAASRIACAETNNAHFPSPLSTSVKEYFIRISALCKEGLVDTLGINKADLYENLLTPLNVKTPATRTTEDQILDIMDTLLKSNFPDLSLYRNQILARLFYEGQDISWFMLLMSLHLYLRIEEIIPEDRALWLKILRILSPKIAHCLMLAQIWITNCTMLNDEDSDLEAATMFEDFVMPRTDRIESLKEFARAIKWPDLERIEQLPNTFSATVDETIFCKGNWMETWARGLVLPGPISSFLLLGSLLDLSIDSSADQYLSLELESSLVDLEHGAADFGLSLYGSSYWHSNCIVGKVLGPHPNVWQVGDWVCGIKLPKYSSSHHFIRIVQSPTRHTIQQSDIEKLALDSDPAGNLDITYSTEDFEIPVVSFRANRDHVQFLSVKFTDCYDEQDSTLHYAYLRFLVDGEKYNRPLRYNVDFVEACHCHDGPHPLYKNYPYKTIKARKLVRLNAWDHADVEDEYNPSSTTLPESAIERVPRKVLVIEASHPDEEILARAWCSNLGLSAIVGSVANNSCSACIIRQAFVSHISVVILTCKIIADSKNDDGGNDLHTPQSDCLNELKSERSSNGTASFSSNVTEELNHEISLDATDLVASGGKNIKISFKAQPSPIASHSAGSSFVVNLTLNVANSESISPTTQKHSPRLQATVEDCTDENEEEGPQHCTTTEHGIPPEANSSTEYAPHPCCLHHVKTSKSTPSLRPKTAPIPSPSASFPPPANTAHHNQPVIESESNEQLEKLKRIQARYQEYHERHRGRQPHKDKEEEPHRAQDSRSTARRDPSTRRRKHSRRAGARHTDRGKTEYAPQPKQQNEAAKTTPSWMTIWRAMFIGKSVGSASRGRNMKYVRDPKLRHGEIRIRVS